MNDTLIGVIVGGLCTSIPAIIAPWITRRSEQKRHGRDLAVQISLELWRRSCAKTDAAKKKIESLPDALPGIRLPSLSDQDFKSTFEEVVKLLGSLK